MFSSHVEMPVPRAWYRALWSDWRLWWPCDGCGGVELPLMSCDDLDELGAHLEAIAAGLRLRGCPGCRTLRERLAAAGDEPEVWHDTILGDWVVRVPCGGRDDSAILPLEIPWFDADEVFVHGVAADLVYSGDALIEEDEWPCASPPSASTSPCRSSPTR